MKKINAIIKSIDNVPPVVVFPLVLVLLLKLTIDMLIIAIMAMNISVKNKIKYQYSLLDALPLHVNNLEKHVLIASVNPIILS